MKKQSNTAVNQLLSIATPQQFISFLFDLQLSLMAVGQFGNYTDKGFHEHALYLRALKEFFEEMVDKK